MRTFLLRALLAAAPLVLPLGCAGGPETAGRETAPNVGPSDESALVAGDTAFAFDLYHQLDATNPSGNLFYSPYSVSLALAMTYAGAAGPTATQIASALHFTPPASGVSSSFGALDRAIEAKPAAATGADGQPFAIDLADALWGDESFAFAPAFVSTLATDFGAAPRTVSFVDQPAQAEDAINAWVAQETNDQIDPLLAPGAVTSDTRLVLVNAVYFNASWAHSFQKAATHPGTFTRADGSTVQTPLMTAFGVATAWASGTNWSAVEMPYAGGTTSMVAVLPDVGAYADVEQGLSGSFYASVTAALAHGGFYLTMPSFKIHGGTISLRTPLQTLGMALAFGDGADFTAMIPAGGVHVSDVLHQAFVDVDESGTEAAAATSVFDSAEVVTPTVVMNRPFFFFIRDVATNTVLFVGREEDPTAE